MPEGLRKRALAVARVAGAAALLGLAVAKLDFAAVGDVLAAANPAVIALAVAVLAAGQAVSALRWRAATRALGTEAPARWFLGSYFRGCFYNSVLPTGIGGDAVRVLHVRELAGGRRAVKGVVYDRAGGLLVTGLVAALALPLSGYGLGTALTAVAVAGAVAGAVVVARVAPADWVALAVAYALTWTAGVALLAAGLHISLPLAAVPAVIAITTVAMALPASIGGMGTREAGFAVALAPLAVPSSQAVALGVAFGIALALVGLAGAPVRLPRLSVGQATA